MIALPGLIISILFLSRISYSILTHFYLVYLSLKSTMLFLASSFVYIPLRHIYTGIFPTVVLLQSIHTCILLYCGSVSTTGMYHNVIRNPIQFGFGLLVDYLSVGLSFRAVAKDILMTKECTEMASIGNEREGKVTAIA